MEYLVAERAGGLMEMPEWSFSNFNIIKFKKNYIVLSG